MEYNFAMPRVRASRDPFNAVAEPKRRQVLDLLAYGERPVNDLVKSLGWAQPQVSKHLGVLKRVGLVSERREGRQRVYTLNAQQLKPIHEWVKKYERFWTHQLDRIKARAERKVQEPKAEGKNSSHD
jgi:DNA-binding transcriptional ArsR family regulator